MDALDCVGIELLIERVRQSLLETLSNNLLELKIEILGEIDDSRFLEYFYREDA